MAPRNPLTNPQWPSPPDLQGEKLADAKLESFKSELAEAATRRAEFTKASQESHVAVEAAQIDVIKGALERSRDSAKAIQASSTAIAGLYTGIGALVFSVGDDRPIPLRGVIPVVFLGAAIVCAAVYLSWLGPGTAVRPFPQPIDATGVRVERTKWLNEWVTLAILKKAWALRLGALYLAAGLLFLPVAFIPVSQPTAAPAAEANVVPQFPDQPTGDDASGEATSGGDTVVDASTGGDTASGSTADNGSIAQGQEDEADATTATLPWPEPPHPPTDRMREALYRAQVKEAGELRTTARDSARSPKVDSSTAVDEEVIWLIAALVFVVMATAIGYQVTKGGLKRATETLSYRAPA